MECELGGKIRDRLGQERRGVLVAPGFACQVILESPVVKVQSSLERVLDDPFPELVVVQLDEHGERIVISVPPAARIQISKQLDDLRLPRPPEISRKFFKAPAGW